MLDLDLKASMVDLLDIDDVDPRQPLRRRGGGHPRIAGRSAGATAAVTEVLLGHTGGHRRHRGGHHDWIADTVKARPVPVPRGLRPMAHLYREALNELDHANKVLKEIGASEPAKRGPAARIIEARAALDLLRGQVDDITQGDFYPYRYFASEGFLPGYSFPRLPLSAFIPADRRTKNGQGDYVQRPRFVAISEFGPGAFIYHEGARYEVDRVSLPTRDDGTGVNITEIKRCNSLRVSARQQHRRRRNLRALRRGSLETLADDDATHWRSKPAAATGSAPTRKNASAPATRSSPASASCPTVSGPARSRPPSPSTAHVLADLTYGDTALIRRMNVGLRRRKDKHIKGYLLDTLEGRWAREADVAQTAMGLRPTSPDSGRGRALRRGPPQRHDDRAGLAHITGDQRMALMYALKRAIEAVFQLESNELAVEPMPGRTGDSRLVAAAVLRGRRGRRRRAAPGGYRRRTTCVASRARPSRILHFDPDTGTDRSRAEHAREDCAQACYDCLLSYANQWDHQHLDRHTVIGLLQTTDAGHPGGRRHHR